jgi:dephospho-CoA kinase
MRARISADPSAKAMLESVTHPAILGRILEQLQKLAASGAPIAVVEAALMVETGSYRNYPLLVVVTCEADTQLQRLMARDGMDEADARRLIATQLPRADKEAVATHVIHNDGDQAELNAQVDAFVARIQETFRPPAP